MDRVPEVLVNGPLGGMRIANNANMSFLRVEGGALAVALSLHEAYVSSGSACSCRVLEPCHVLLAIGRKHEEVHGSILFKLCHYYKEDDVKYALEVVPRAIEMLRKITAWR